MRWPANNRIIHPLARRSSNFGLRPPRSQGRRYSTFTSPARHRADSTHRRHWPKLTYPGVATRVGVLSLTIRIVAHGPPLPELRIARGRAVVGGRAAGTHGLQLGKTRWIVGHPFPTRPNHPFLTRQPIPPETSMLTIAPRIAPGPLRICGRRVGGHARLTLGRRGFSRSDPTGRTCRFACPGPRARHATRKHDNRRQCDGFHEFHKSTCTAWRG